MAREASFEVSDLATVVLYYCGVPRWIQSTALVAKRSSAMTVKETAEVLHVSQETVLRDWKLAKSWLRRELSKEPSRGR